MARAHPCTHAVNGRCEREPRVTREGGSVRAQSRQRLTSPCKSTRSTRPCPWLQQLRSRHTATTSAKEALALGCTASAPKMIDANIGPVASAESDQDCQGTPIGARPGDGTRKDAHTHTAHNSDKRRSSSGVPRCGTKTLPVNWSINWLSGWLPPTRKLWLGTQD